jgi:FKBP-type peptidyl-prolyl cis-trans isomerase FkpA
LQKILIFYLVSFSLFQNCDYKRKKNGQIFSHHPSGYYYQLISFHNERSTYTSNHIAWVSACFRTQADSVFWDSFNNLNDKFYVETDSLEKGNFLKNYISKCSALDSACVLIPTKEFFAQQFKSRLIPYFSARDSVVKVNFKIQRVLSPEEFDKTVHNLRKGELKQIEDFYGSPKKLEMALDPAGFYWIEKPTGLNRAPISPGDRVTLSYEGRYLNGRIFERSKGHFEFIYGTPDQVLKGINYVIARLKLGDNAKIILPSRLAFGENGSSNGTVPPYTPLIYEIKIIDIKTQNSL